MITRFLQWQSRVWRKQLEDFLFERAPTGELLYVPMGTATALGWWTRIIPDDAARERILAIHRRWSVRIIWVSLFAIAVLISTLVIARGNVKATLSAAVACLGVILAFSILAKGLILREIGPLPRGPRRGVRNILAVHDRQMGPTRNAWLYSLFFLFILGISLYAGYESYRDGRTSVALIVAAFATLVYVPLIALGPYILKMRRLREENARLESLVAARTEELRELNRTLETRVLEQVQHIERLGQLKHFFAAPVAEMILNEKEFDPARVHRRELTALSIDLRGFTAFSETSEPEEVISVLRAYHAELGIQVNRCQATLEHFAGDGVMIFLNDPIEVPDHPLRALDLAIALRAAMQSHLKDWRANGFDLGLGMGLATGYATIGAVGYEGRWEYAAIGTVCNLAARLCAEAKDGQIVVSQRFVSRLGNRAALAPLGELSLKGLSRPVAAFNVIDITAPEAQPALA